ncbi:polysaccharide pyruvyl transferase family protein [Thalassococcus sp. CAU 1522]|uniref:Polysaccharide pyruvyl transferase family protein n=1 Tax=Thalassococcus arenae TaxID=2851652 RepID=A0ABS6N897_9RHOB|nr:polysaccharide pyruvyl transferase family protein [Thalassococcus arenae]MBV2360248.1 polysaccharide pyruvyl transferase family protein [Thalassococcus arenae]
MSSTDIRAEIAGVWLPNKGAELMAVTAVTELRARIPGIAFCSKAQGPDARRAALGMPAFEPRKGSVWHRTEKLWPGIARPRATRAERPGVTHVIDASGFAYGDSWGAGKARSRAAAYIAAGYPTYLLPQAFGPFETPKLRGIMQDIVRGARSISARDRQSQAHLEGLGTGREITVVPDITLGLAPDPARVAAPDTPFAAVVINAMLLKSGTFGEDRLMALYRDILTTIANCGVAAKIVLHEPEADRTLSEELAAFGGADLVAFDDPLDIKSYLSRARVVVTARFHGLANGLSCGVPSLAVGWSHKYAELLEDFGTPEMMFQGDDAAFLARIREQLTSDEAQRAVRARLLERKAAFARTLARYWDGIAEDMLRQR